MKHLSLPLIFTLLAGIWAISSAQESDTAPTSADGVIKGPRPDPASFPDSESFYPPESKMIRESGWLFVRACVATDGTLIGMPTIEGSSGSPRLDQAGLALAQAGSGHYLPATKDGRPVARCFVFKVMVTLRH
jgi:outer membrane biosynthesis protein TonB